MNKRKPAWLKVKIESGKNINNLETLLQKNHLNTVCNSAKCPNRLECFSNKTATFLAMGTKCTRNCGFCNIDTARPLPLDKDEPLNIAKAVLELQLEYVVITSVTRDDLPDGGASHFVEIVKRIRDLNSNVKIELLIPDLKGDYNSLNKIIDIKPDVLNHNMESVKSLYSTVRKGASYSRSLDLLKYIKDNSSILTKTGIMLGLGEEESEVKTLLQDIHDTGCDLLTIGQYCQPTNNHLEVRDYITPEKFNYWKEFSVKIGFKGVASGPLVRSSYNARSLQCTI